MDIYRPMEERMGESEAWNVCRLFSPNTVPKADRDRLLPSRGTFVHGDDLLFRAQGGQEPPHKHAQAPSTGLRHPSLEEGAGKRCSECEACLVPIQKSSGMNLAERRLRQLELCLSKERGMCLYAEVVTEVDRLVLSFQPTCHRVRRRRNTCVLGMDMPA